MTEKQIPREGQVADYLTLYIGREKTRIRVRMKKDGIVIGRNTKREKVDVDTKPFNGIEKGVSRHHVYIAPKRDHFYVRDLESANSTWHNRVRMRPNVAEELYHGDVLHLGELRIEVHYTYQDEIQEELGDTTLFDDNANVAATAILNEDDLPAPKNTTNQLRDDYTDTDDD